MKLQKCEVHKLDCVDWLDKMIAELGEDPMVRNLKLDSVKQNINDTQLKVEAFVKASLEWTFPHDFTSDRQHFLSLFDEYITAMAQTWRHVDSVTSKLTQKSVASTNEKGNWRTERTKLKTHLMGKKVAAGPAKVVADVAWSSVSPPSKLDITLPYESPVCMLSQDSDLTAFNLPFIVQYDDKATEDHLSLFASSWGQHYRENAAASQSKMKECQALMRAGDSGYANTTLTVSTSMELNLPSPMPPWFDMAIVKPGFWTSHTEILNATTVCWPYARIPQWLLVYVSQCVIIVVDGAVALRVGNISAWLASCEASELARMPSFFARPGDAIWVPPGHVAVAVGIPLSIKMDPATGVNLKGAKPNQHHFMALGIYPVLDPGWVATYSVELRAAIGAAWTTAKEELPLSWMKVPKVTEFEFALFPKAQAPAEVEPAAVADADGAIGDGNAGADSAA